MQDLSARDELGRVVYPDGSKDFGTMGAIPLENFRDASFRFVVIGIPN